MAESAKPNGSETPKAGEAQEAASTEAAPYTPLPEYPPFPEDPDLPKADADLIFSTFMDSAGDSKDRAKPAEAGKGVDAPSSDPASTAQGGSGEPSAPSVAPSPKPAGVPPTQVPGQGGQPPSPVVTAPAAAQTDLRYQSLEATVAALQQQNALLLQQMQSRAAPQQEATPSAQPGMGGLPAQPQPYNLALPQDAMTALFNQDGDLNQATAALQHIVNHALGIAEHRILQHTQGLINTALQGYQSQSSEQAERQRMQQEYFAKFKEHDNPIFRQVVASEAGAMWAELPNLPWSKEACDALGARVNTKLQQMGFNSSTVQQMQQQTEQGLNADAPVQVGSGGRPPAMTGAGTRAGGAGTGGGGSFIASTLG